MQDLRKWQMLAFDRDNLFEQFHIADDNDA